MTDVELSDRCITSLSVDELTALAEARLAPAAQDRLSDLLERKSNSRISDDELKELDSILKTTDQLMILKARARYTLAKQSPVTA